MFAILPEDIVRLVLEDYVRVCASDLSNLDVAVTNRGCRHLFLATLAKLSCLMECLAPRALGSCLLWVASRQLRVRGLRVNSESELDCACALDELTVFPFITAIEFKEAHDNIPTAPFLAHFLNLERLEMEHSESSLSDPDVVQVIRDHPSLTHFAFPNNCGFFNRDSGSVYFTTKEMPDRRQGVSTFTEFAVFSFLSFCNNIAEIRIWQSTLLLSRTTGGRRVCDIRYGNALPTDTDSRQIIAIVSVMAHVDISIRSFLSLGTENNVDNQLLECIADFCASSLQSLWICVNDVDAEAMLYLLEQCPNLTNLSLSGRRRCHFNSAGAAAILAQLPIHCPKISELHLIAVEESDLLVLIGGLASLELKVLDVLFVALTDATLFKVVQYFPDLIGLGVTLTKVTEHALLELVLSGRLRCTMIECDKSQWIKQQLEDSRFQPMPIIWGWPDWHRVRRSDNDVWWSS